MTNRRHVKYLLLLIALLPMPLRAENKNDCPSCAQGSIERAVHQDASKVKAGATPSNVELDLGDRNDHYRRELEALHERVNLADSQLSQLEINSFSPTTKLSVQSSFVVGGNAFYGSASSLVETSQGLYGAATFNYDTRLILDSSFNGSDLLRIRLRAGNFDSTSNSFGGGGPSVLSQLEVAFQEPTGSSVLAVNRLYYQVPLGDFTFTLGATIMQDDMMAIWPSLYPSETVLDLMTFGGAIGANDLSLGSGLGLWWRKDGFAVSALYIASNGNYGNPENGGFFTPHSGSTTSVQIGYSKDQWAIAAMYSAVQNGAGLIPYATDFALLSFEQPGNTSALGLNGYWQPSRSGWIPSISAGWGINHTTYDLDQGINGLVQTSQSWALGLLWSDAFYKDNTLGFAVGQAVYALSTYGQASPDDSNLVLEASYKVRMTDNISVMPAIFYLYRPLGASTPDGESFNQLGGLVRITFRL